MNDKTAIAGLGIACVTALEAIALYKGLDGTYFSLVIGGICTVVAGVVGYKQGQTSSTT